MALGRGSANKTMALVLASACLLLHIQITESAVYTAGDGEGWTFNMATWPKGKNFKAADVLGIFPRIKNFESEAMKTKEREMMIALQKMLCERVDAMIEFDAMLDLNLERLRMAVEDLLAKLAKLFSKPKSQTIFLINNYDMTIAILKEAGTEGGKAQLHFEEILKSNIAIYVEELLLEHFSDLIKFVKTRASEESGTAGERQPTIADTEPLVKDFSSRWKISIELMHKDVITSFSNFLCGMEILKAALTQLLLYYTRLTECVKRINGGSVLNKDLVSISSILYEIRKYSRTF